MNRPRVIVRFRNGAWRCGFDEGAFLAIGCAHKSEEGVADHAEWFARRNRVAYAARELDEAQGDFIEDGGAVALERLDRARVRLHAALADTPPTDT